MIEQEVEVESSDSDDENLYMRDPIVGPIYNSNLQESDSDNDENKDAERLSGSCEPQVQAIDELIDETDSADDTGELPDMKYRIPEQLTNFIFHESTASEVSSDVREAIERLSSRIEHH